MVAHYNEDLSWLLPYANLVHVYHKGSLNKPLNQFAGWTRLPNVGREGHTYLVHIINNYHNLADITFFLQGRIADHAGAKNLDDLLPEVIANGIAFFGNPYHPSYGCNPHGYGSFNRFLNFWHNILHCPMPENIVFYPGACFGVKKALIHNRSIDFYKQLLRNLSYHVCPEAGYHIERMWYFMLDPKKLVRFKILSNFFDL